MTRQKYREDDLVTNRASLLLFGGSAAERRAWAEEAQSHFPEEGPLRELAAAQSDVTSSLSEGRGVLFIPDLAQLGWEAQRQLVHCLFEREERPKLVLGLSTSPELARQAGKLREDLLFRLRQAIVDLGSAELRARVAARQQRAQAKLAARKAAEAAKAAARGAKTGRVTPAASRRRR